MSIDTRTAQCPRGCGGTLTISEQPTTRDEHDRPGGWSIVGVRCSMGCHLRAGEVPRRA